MGLVVWGLQILCDLSPSEDGPDWGSGWLSGCHARIRPSNGQHASIFIYGLGSRIMTRKKIGTRVDCGAFLRSFEDICRFSIFMCQSHNRTKTENVLAGSQECQDINWHTHFVQIMMPKMRLIWCWWHVDITYASTIWMRIAWSNEVWIQMLMRFLHPPYIFLYNGPHMQASPRLAMREKKRGFGQPSYTSHFTCMATSLVVREENTENVLTWSQECPEIS